MVRYSPSEFSRGPSIQAGCVRAVGDISNIIFHPVGTAAMGSGPEAAAPPAAPIAISQSLTAA
jgi:choline dehydrogenase